MLHDKFTFDNLHGLRYMVRLSHVILSCNLFRIKMYIIYVTNLFIYVAKLHQLCYMTNR